VQGARGGALAVAADVDSDVLREGQGEAGRGKLFLLLLLGLPLLLLGFARSTSHMLLVLLLLGGMGEGGGCKGGGGGADALTASSVEEIGEAVRQVHPLRAMLHAKTHANGQGSYHDHDGIGFQEGQEGGRRRGGAGEGGEQGIVVVLVMLGFGDAFAFHGLSCGGAGGGAAAGHGVLVFAGAVYVRVEGCGVGGECGSVPCVLCVGA